MRITILAVLAGLLCPMPGANPAHAEPPFPPLAGAYDPATANPGVFTSARELADIAVRVRRTGSFSARTFALLAEQVQRDLGSPARWEATYSGCDIDIYLHSFAYEPAGGYANETRSRQQLNAALGIEATARPPAGAAVVASRLALYAAMVRAGAPLPAGAPNTDQAAALSRRILLAWAGSGFRDPQGKLVSAGTQACDARGQTMPQGTPLQVSRGMVVFVQAQDLLHGMNLLSAAQVAQLNAFDTAMYDLILSTDNAEYEATLRTPYPDMIYNNQGENVLAALLGIARILDDRTRFLAAIDGANPAIPVKLNWINLFNHLIYGMNDTPLRIHPNEGPDGPTSRPSFVTPVVEPGEINDRYRNANPLQGIGYPMFSLERLFMSSEVLTHAGFKPYAYKGWRGQSIEMAMRYYACYEATVGEDGTVTAQNARACPNNAQYVGKVVNGVAPNLLVAAYRYPNQTAFTALLPRAMAAKPSSPSALDAVLFGKWPD